MTITFLNHNAFEELEGIKKPFHSGWGRGRNVTHIKKDKHGNLYGKLSPIADPVYDGHTQEVVGESTVEQLRRLFERSDMEFTGITARTKCIGCGKEIAVTRQFITDEGFEYKTENADCRYIDKWGFARNFCKDCIK